MTEWKNIKALALDVDGVMTDGSLPAFDSGEIIRVFNAKDTFAIRAALHRGLLIAVFTGGYARAIRNRFVSLGVDPREVHMSCRGKIDVFNDFCHRNSISPEEVAFAGDDIPDIPVLRAAGIGVAPADASEDAKQAADIVSEYGGGRGCIRDMVEKILKAKGLWTFDDADYHALF